MGAQRTGDVRGTGDGWRSRGRRGVWARRAICERRGSLFSQLLGRRRPPVGRPSLLIFRATNPSPTPSFPPRLVRLTRQRLIGRHERRRAPGAGREGGRGKKKKKKEAAFAATRGGEPVERPLSAFTPLSLSLLHPPLRPSTPCTPSWMRPVAPPPPPRPGSISWSGPWRSSAAAVEEGAAATASPRSRPHRSRFRPPSPTRPPPTRPACLARATPPSSPGRP